MLIEKGVGCTFGVKNDNMPRITNEYNSTYKHLDYTDDIAKIIKSEIFKKNKVKEAYLNNAISNAYRRLKLKVEDLTNKYNFKGKVDEHTADYLTDGFSVTEGKNWNCYNHKGYHITANKANDEILSRFEPYPHELLKILVIGKPKWGKGVKAYIESKGIDIIELGFQVDGSNIKEATQIIYRQLVLLYKRSFGYSSICTSNDNTNDNILNVYNDIDKNNKISSKTSEVHPLKDKFRALATASSNVIKQFKQKLSGFSACFHKNKDEANKISLDNKFNSVSICNNCQAELTNKAFKSPYFCDSCIIKLVIENYNSEVDKINSTNQEVRRLYVC